MNKDKKPEATSKLIYLIDYYLEEGKYVFTSHYHRKRGYCCQSNCRHCPYGKDGTGVA